MVLSVRPDSTVPIYEQIAAQVVFGVAAGDPPPGGLVPSVRDLAQRLLVNPNTVARAYQDLERLGVLESKRGRGMEVTTDAPALCHARRREIVRSRLRDVLREAAAGGLPGDEVLALVEEEWARLNGRARRRGREDRT
jgi:GntR family transcriptional regulator